MSQINLDPTFDDQIMKYVVDNFNFWSQITITKPLNENILIEHLTKHFGNYKQCIYSDDYTLLYNETLKEEKLVVYNGQKALFFDKIVVQYSKDFGHKPSKQFSFLEDEDDEDDDQNDVDLLISNNENINNIFIYYNSYNDNKLELLNMEIKNKLETLINELSNHFILKKDSVFYTIGASQYGFSLSEHKVIDVNDDIGIHYGESFVPKLDNIMDNLCNKNHGLILLHGDPGTGKTNLIRYIISKMYDKKKIIYIPAYMVEQFANPEFITFLQKHKNSILILEDAEFALQKRGAEYGAQAVSNLLNITSGLLNDAIGIQVIATFNMDKKKLDDALLRPGRLLNEHKFEKLSIDDAKKLAKYINKKDLEITQPMTVAEIYNGVVQEKRTKTFKGIA